MTRKPWTQECRRRRWGRVARLTGFIGPVLPPDPSITDESIRDLIRTLEDGDREYREREFVDELMRRPEPEFDMDGGRYGSCVFERF
jgi:hypothetical protein